MRIDDDSHVQVDHLESFLNKLDPKRPLFIGAPGWVLPTVKYEGHRLKWNPSRIRKARRGFHRIRICILYGWSWCYFLKRSFKTT